MGLKTKATLTLNEAFQKWRNQFGSHTEEVDSFLLHKIRHTYGVLEVGQDIMTLEKSFWSHSSEVISQVESALILHDIGRFFQVNKERVLSGKEREHGNKWALLLSQDNYRKYFPMVLLGVKYHNKYNILDLTRDVLFLQLSPEEKKNAEFIIKLVRDADKLQNMKYIAFDIQSFFDVDGSFPRNPLISEKLLLMYESGKLLSWSDAKTLAERALCYVSRKNELYFEGTKQQLMRSGFFERVYEFLQDLGVQKETLDRLNLI